MQQILVTLAVEPEFAPWRRLRGFRRVPLKNLSVYRAAVGDAEVLVSLTGIGARQPLPVTNALPFSFHPRLAIVGGVAAGLKKGLRPGDIVVAERVCDADLTRGIQSDLELLHLGKQCGAKHVSRLLTLPRLARRAEEKSGLAQWGDAAEMETLPIMEQLSCWALPAVAVRAIADPVEYDVPCDFEAALDAQGQVKIWPVLAQLARRPQDLPRLIQFGLMSHHATVALAHFLDRFIERLTFRQTVCDSPVAAVVA